jgi:hypothetical protein
VDTCGRLSNVDTVAVAAQAPPQSKGVRCGRIRGQAVFAACGCWPPSIDAPPQNVTLGCPRCLRNCGHVLVLSGRQVSAAASAAALSTAGACGRPAVDRPHARQLRQWTQPPHAVFRCGHCGPRHGGLSGRGCPPRTLAAASGRCGSPGVSAGYRKRSPARRPLDGCRHRRYARTSWRCSRSPS